MRKSSNLFLLVVLLFLSACSAQPTEDRSPTSEVLPVATVRGSDPQYTNVTSNGIVTFTDSISGISLDYPEGWIMDQVRGGARSPSVFVFTNYFHIPALMDNIPPEDTVVYLTILQPNPDATYSGLIDSFKQQWLSEGSSILSEEDVVLVSGQTGKTFLVDSYLGKQFYYLFTQVGEKLLYIEAIGDLTPVPPIALSIR